MFLANLVLALMRLYLGTPILMELMYFEEIVLALELNLLVLLFLRKLLDKIFLFLASSAMWFLFFNDLNVLGELFYIALLLFADWFVIVCLALCNKDWLYFCGLRINFLTLFWLFLWLHSHFFRYFSYYSLLTFLYLYFWVFVNLSNIICRL